MPDPPLPKMPFGKYRGEPLSVVPENYLAWAMDIVREDWMRRAIRLELDRRGLTDHDVNRLRRQGGNGTRREQFLPPPVAHTEPQPLEEWMLPGAFQESRDLDPRELLTLEELRRRKPVPERPYMPASLRRRVQG